MARGFSIFGIHKDGSGDDATIDLTCGYMISVKTDGNHELMNMKTFNWVPGVEGLDQIVQHLSV